MLASLMTHDELITKLGGPKRIAQALGLPYPNLVSRWRWRGIPPMHWHRIVAFAAQAGIDVSADELAEGYRGIRGLAARRRRAAEYAA
jgi:hypothetical protein